MIPCRFRDTPIQQKIAFFLLQIRLAQNQQEQSFIQFQMQSTNMINAPECIGLCVLTPNSPFLADKKQTELITSDYLLHLNS